MIMLSLTVHPIVKVVVVEARSWISLGIPIAVSRSTRNNNYICKNSVNILRKAITLCLHTIAVPTYYPSIFIVATVVASPAGEVA